MITTWVAHEPSPSEDLVKPAGQLASVPMPSTTRSRIHALGEVAYGRFDLGSGERMGADNSGFFLAAAITVVEDAGSPVRSIVASLAPTALSVATNTESMSIRVEYGRPLQFVMLATDRRAIAAKCEIDLAARAILLDRTVESRSELSASRQCGRNTQPERTTAICPRRTTIPLDDGVV
jgi:hypothetical protein